MGEFHKVGKTSEIADGTGICVMIGAKNIAVFNCGGAFYAIDDECSHEEGPLSEGELEGFEVECPWHMARFDVRNGKALCEPACGDVSAYAVRVTGDDIEVEV